MTLAFSLVEDLGIAGGLLVAAVLAAAVLLVTFRGIRIHLYNHRNHHSQEAPPDDDVR